jgi:outer membrane protein assembly factor BamB
MMARNPQRRPSLWLATTAVAVSFVALADAHAQVRRPLFIQGNTYSRPEEVPEKVFLTPDRPTLKKLAESRRLLAEGRFGEAVRNLDAILEATDDFFFEPDKDSGRSRGLKAEAQRLIAQMPREGREAYELQYGARARQMLGQALETGNVGQLAEVSRRFFHTRSGYEATFLLGLHHFDHGRPLESALTLRRLFETGESMEEFEPALSLTTAVGWLQAGMTDKARETLVALRERHPSLRLTVAGRETPIFTNNAEAVEWLVKLIGPQTTAAAAELDNWLMFRGDAARNASMAGGVPLLNVRWRVVSTDDPVAEASLGQSQKMHSLFGNPTIPAFHPLAVGDVLLMRTMQNLLAVDLTSGKRLWEIPVDTPAEPTPGDAAAAELRARRANFAQLMGQRICDDLTYGTLSSDGRYVFSVEDVGSESGSAAFAGQGNAIIAGNLIVGGGVARVRRLNGRVVVLGGGLISSADQAVSPSNQLAAHEIRTGKLKWQIGGPSGQHALRQPDTFFLGPPLPLQGQLYVLAEVKGEIRLMALEAAEGKVLWSQQLASADSENGQSPERRTAGVSPSYADGVLVCPTATGAIVGVELATRSLLWGHCFGPEQAGTPRNAAAWGGPVVPMNVNGEASPTSWIDHDVTISDGRVLVTAINSEMLYCLSLINGEMLWKQPRKDGLYLASVDREKAVVVGQREVRAYRVSDGKPFWGGRTIALPDNSAPSGRGFASGNRYFLPLTNAEVIDIDLATAKIERACKSRKGTIPGNLVCFKGTVISQGLEGVDAYYQRDAVSTEVTRRLAANANDAEALSLRGEIQLDDGKQREAIASFRRAYELASDPRSRELLRDSLLDGLRSEFSAYRGHAAEIERLLDTPLQRAAFFRAMAAGLRQAGEPLAAFDYYQKLGELDPNRRPLDQVGKSLVVRRDRWLRDQLTELRRSVDGEAAAKIDQAVAARLQSAQAATSLEPLQRFVDGFGDQPAASQGRDELLQRLRTAGRRIEVELAEPPAPSPERRAEEHGPAWPNGKVEIATAPTKSTARNYYGRNILDLRGDAEACFRDLSVQFEASRQSIVAFDSLGRERWRVPLTNVGQTSGFAYNASQSLGFTSGHLLVVALGWKVVAIDTLGLGAAGTPRVLWTQDLLGRPLDVNDDSLTPQAAILNAQLQQQFVQIHDQSRLLGPVSRSYVCFQRFHSLVAVDPRNGETLWTRQDVPLNSDVFGDDQYVLVLPPESDEARVLRASDGEMLGTRKVPRITGQQVLPSGETKPVFGRLEEACLATLGRKMLLWWPEGNQRVLTLVDPLEGRDLWRGHRFSSGAKACVVDNEAVGVVEPSGRFVLLSLPEGRTIADVKLEAEPSLTELTLIASGGQYFVLTRSSRGEANAPPFQPMPGCPYQPIYRGRLYAIDRSGKLLWPAPAKIKNQFLLTNQPADLPVLTFACHISEQNPNGQTRYRTSVKCIDKRNGRTAFQRKFENTTGIFNVSGDAAKKTVDLTMQQNTVTLTFTDTPIPPPTAKSGKPPRDKAVRALWNSVQKILGAGDDDSDQED